MLKRLSADALGLLVVLVFVTFSGVVAYWVYLTVLWLGFGDKAAYWSAIVSIGVMGVLFYSRSTQIPSDTLTMWGLTLLRWVLIAAAVLVTGIGVLIVIINPPSLYSLVVIGVVLLAGILWQLMKLTNR